MPCQPREAALHFEPDGATAHFRGIFFSVSTHQEVVVGIDTATKVVVFHTVSVGLHFHDEVLSFDTHFHGFDQKIVVFNHKC